MDKAISIGALNKHLLLPKSLLSWHVLGSPIKRNMGEKGYIYSTINYLILLSQRIVLDSDIDAQTIKGGL